MLTKDACLPAIKAFRVKYGLDASDENVIATIHLMNTFGIDVNAALDQSSRSSNDHGIDAWCYHDANRELFILQSKLTESKAAALRGLSDLSRAQQWLEQIVTAGQIDAVPSDNHCLFNLYRHLSSVRRNLKKIHFTLISLFNQNELEDSDEYTLFETALINSGLNKFVRESLNGKIIIDASEYNLDPGIPEKTKVYPIPAIPHTRVHLRKNAHLDLAYVSLQSLVELLRARGEVLFDKNVRLSLVGNKEARDRLVHPMEETLDFITSGKNSPSIFPFYHIGVTISATSSTMDEPNVLNLVAPSIINGCQTIVIAHEYLKRLEKQKKRPEIERFNEIKVIAKVVVGTTNEELKEITNSNNRQNPIENWQLFSNEPIHVELEAALKDIGIFYERQKGKFDSVMKRTDNAQHYFATNGAYIRVMDLGQVIALSRGDLQAAAKPSEIFVNKGTHDKVFDRSMATYPRDIVFVSNLWKAMRRALNNYLDLPTQANSNAPVIFKRQIVRAHVFYLALLHFYQNENRHAARAEFAYALNRKAPPRLVEDVQGFYQRVITKTRNWYTDESKGLTVEVSKRRMSLFFETLATELGIDISDGARPFSRGGIDRNEESKGAGR